ncbi:hypothetical protein ACVWXQ_009620 [Bradyrhizobium sp. S3.14.4]
MVCIPRMGGGLTWLGGAFDPAALQPSDSWNGSVARRRTAAISRDQDPAGTIRRAGRAPPTARDLVGPPGQATGCHQGAGGLRQELIGSHLGRDARARRQCRCVADDRSGRRRGHAVSVLRFPGPASRLPGRRRRRDRADPREQFDRPNGDPVEPDQRSGGDGGRRLPVSRGLSLGQRFSHPSDRRVFFEARTVPTVTWC